MPEKTKPTPEQELLLKSLLEKGLISNAREICKLYNIYHPSITSEASEKWLAKFITQDDRMKKVKDKCRILTNANDIVLIVGETGTGKELLAQSLHGDRSGKFLAINCAAIPDELIESELFGHIAGAFTGAFKDRVGIFQAAHNGTVFLDEVGELPLIAQASLLRALQENTVRKIGTNSEEKINCRIVCATWHDLKLSVEKGVFRRDLYYRLGRIVLHTCPLRERPGDIELIIDALDTGKKLSKEYRERVVTYITSNGAGNVRELENIIRRVELFGEQESGL